jgi:hypothetical protein
MMKILIGGLVGVVSYAMATVGISKFDLVQRMKKPQQAVATKSEIRKTRTINIPVFAERQAKGYVVVQFAFKIEGEEAKRVADTAEVYILDEAIGFLFKRSAESGVALERYDIQDLAPIILKNVQQRLNSTQVTELLVQEFSYVSRADVR